VSGTAGTRVQAILVGTAIAIVIVSIAIVPFLTPPWLAFEQGRAQAPAWTGFSEADLATVTNAIVADLVAGGEFDIELGGAPVLNERERSHMRDVRTVFQGLWALTVAAIVVLLVALRGDRARVRRDIARGAAVLAVAVVGAGAVALVAFDALFEAFHRIFFAGGSYTFDPGEDRLVQLFPFTFWQETAIVVGVVIVLLAALVWWVAREPNRVTRSDQRTADGPNAATPERA
jgi:integral membrane protein (TIGR01906 family)